MLVMSELEFEAELIKALPIGRRVAMKVVPPADVDDVLQDASFNAWRFIHTFRKDSSFSTWFTRIVYNTSFMALRKLKKQKERMISDSVEMESGEDASLFESFQDDGCWNPEAMVIRAEQRRELRRLIKGLKNPLLEKQIKLYMAGRSGNNSKEKARVNRAKELMMERAQGVS